MLRVFCLSAGMHPREFKTIPALIAAAVILCAGGVEILHPHSADRLECMSYDLRVRWAQTFRGSSTIATNLGFVAITDQTITAIGNGTLGYHYGLYWPRHIYGRALQELTAQGARAVAFDVIFADLRPDHAPVKLPDGTLVPSDDYFATELKRSGSAILAANRGVIPEPLFRNNAAALGNISVQIDSDGILRRDKPFQDLRIWHPIILKAAAEYGFDLTKTKIQRDTLTLVRERGSEAVTFPLDAQGKLAIADFSSDPLPESSPRHFQLFTPCRVWSLGIVLAARELNLDLDNAIVGSHQIILPGPNHTQRVIPLDRDGNFYIEWSIKPNDPALAKGTFDELLLSQNERSLGNEVTNRWKDKLILIGSIATGNDLTDLGATPLGRQTFLASKHWNVANSIITNRFVIPCPLWAALALIALVGIISAWTTWVMRPLSGSLLLLFFLAIYLGISFWLYVRFGFWLPVVLPCLCAGLVTHVCTVTYRVRVEQSAKKHVQSVFSKIVSPNVVNELLSHEKISLGGERRELTVLFADIRGFTELTDVTQTQAEDYVRQNQLAPKEAELYLDQQAAEILATVSLCLGIIAETIKQHNGTLDKYIGDCVMAFWGAPTADPQHALHCVQAAIDAQRALHNLNEERARQNQRIDEENQSRARIGLPAKPALTLISLGTGINTGPAIVGLMGSEAHILNYTVFGREVNLASRLEGVSGHGRIVIGENTYRSLQRDNPALAATCLELPPVKIKGFQHEVKAYEVLWKKP